MTPLAALCVVARPARLPESSGDDEIALLVEADEAHLVDGLAGARQEHIQDRQRAVDRPGGQLRLHVFGDEEAQVEDRGQRALHIAQAGIHGAARKTGQLRHVADRLEAAQHIGRGRREKRRGVEEIRAAEHVQHGVVLLRQVLLGEGAHLRQRAGVLAGEDRIEEARVLRPARIFGQCRQRRARRRRQAGEEARGIVRLSRSRRCAPARPAAPEERRTARRRTA